MFYPRLELSLSSAGSRLGLAAFVEDRRGALMAIAATVVPVVFGFAALAVDVGLWRLEKLRLQSAVDTAALAGAHAQLAGNGLELTRAIVSRELARNGYDPADPRVSFELDLRHRDALAPYSDVHVTASTPGAYYFAKLLMPEPPTIASTAVSGIDKGNTGRVCVLGLEEQAPGTVQFRGNPEIDLNCSIASNSRDATLSMDVAGNSAIAVTALIASGGISNVDSAGISAAAIWQFAPPTPDPFGPRGRNLQAPPPGSCNHNGEFRVSSDTTLTPGRYCGGIRVTGATATFEPGLYVIHNGNLRTVGQARLVGDGVTFVLTGSAPAQIGSMDFAGGTHLDLRAPTAGQAWAKALNYEGILFFQDPRARESLSSNGDNKLLGGTIARLEGAAYFPRQTLMYTGGADLDDSCLLLVARQVLFRGNARFVQTTGSCDDLGVEDLRPPSVRLLG